MSERWSEAANDLAGRIAQHARLVPLGLVHGAAQVAGLVEGVGVGEEQPAAAGVAGCGPDGVGFAGPARLELGGFQDGDTGKAAGDFGRAVRGVVVDHDQLPILAEVENLFGLADQGLEARGQTVGFVACRNDDGELDELLRVRAGEDGSGSGAGPLTPIRVADGSAGFVGPVPAPFSVLRRLRHCPRRASPLHLAAFFPSPSLRIIRMCGFLVAWLSVVAFTRPARPGATAARIPRSRAQRLPISRFPTARPPCIWPATAAGWFC